MKSILIIDGGTTNLRVSVVSTETSEILGMVKAEGGVKYTAIDGNNYRLREMLRDCILQVLQSARLSFSDIDRCIAYGMITSGLGLLEIPHLAAPVSAAELRAGMQTKRFDDIAPLPISFIPGVRNFYGEVGCGNVSDMDMMRGEEVEAVGLATELNLTENALLILPGSHNKFVRLDEQHRILGCSTSISGELLDAITHHTILSGSVGGSFCDAESYDSALALRGAEECRNFGLGRAAFAGRILQTLGKLPERAIQSFLLGAVLAEDEKALHAFIPDGESIRVIVAGKAPLQQAVCDVLRAGGMQAVEAVPQEISARMGICGALTVARS